MFQVQLPASHQGGAGSIPDQSMYVAIFCGQSSSGDIFLFEYLKF